MYSLTVLIICSLIGLAVGLGIGVLLAQRVTPSGQKRREAERQLDQALQEKKAYEDEVVEHFTDTAKLLNQLTDSYREVHNHLARGAADLCRGSGPVALDQMNRKADPAKIPADLADIQPPRDYAPKASPDQKGILSEGYGLEREENADEVTTRTPPPL
ncbi:YhcB family protein [Haliea sp. E17]|uniref:YhcB family protein n=1 Tax=Haliea sp. E17 TaxID=3401576 RepID=UPI003AAD6B0D